MNWQADPRQIADPFGERAVLALRRVFGLLGAAVEFRSDSADLMALAEAAYGGLPAPALDGPRLQLELRLVDGGADWGAEPPLARMLGGAGLLGCALDACNFALVSPETGRAVVQLSRGMLDFAYHARYELIEFAGFTLAGRARRLLALHAGCVGLGGAGALLMGGSGAGKSTLALQAMLLGLDLMTEDASFVDVPGLRVSGVANFLHLRLDALRWLEDAALRERVAAAPRIRRRSGVEKYELDLRGGWARRAAAPLRLAQLVFASPEAAGDGVLLRPLDPAETVARLRACQPYALGQPGWAAFEAGCARLHGWELRRGAHPREMAAALHGLLMRRAPG